jgi:hypothetical protein
MAPHLRLPDLHLDAEIVECTVTAPPRNHPTITLHVPSGHPGYPFNVYGTDEQLLAFAASIIAAVNEHMLGPALAGEGAE